MNTFKELIEISDKKIGYDLYTKINNKHKSYNNITRVEIYNNIINTYLKDPEIILKMLNVEQINILKKLLEENIYLKNAGYIEYLLLKDLKEWYLVFENEKEYFIPKDLINPIKMALNLYNEEEYTLKDITDSVLIGLIRSYNVIYIDDFITYLKSYSIIFDKLSLKEYLKFNLRTKSTLKVVKYNKQEYIISLEYPYYKDILKLKTSNPNNLTTLEEIISIGKYKINLFKKEIFSLLSFLEQHLDLKYIDYLIDNLIIYAGFNLNDLTLLKKIANVEPLYYRLLKVIPELPIWTSQ